MFYLKAYTRKVAGNDYSISIAGSIHFKYSYDGINFSPLNQNYGILFPKAMISENNTIIACALQNAEIFTCDGGYIIAGDYLDIQKNHILENKKYIWKTSDFITFEEIGFVDAVSIDSSAKVDNETVILSDEEGKKIINIWAPLYAKTVYVSDKNNVKCVDDLFDIKAVIEYSDGSTDDKDVNWFVPKDIIGNDGCLKPGKYEISGLITKEKYEFPLTRGYADPVVFKWEDKWHLLSTNDNLDDIGLYIRRADTVEGLFDGSATERCILAFNEEKDFVQTFWAPEFHVIGGEAYILLAIGGAKWAPQSYMMKLKKGCDLLRPQSYEEPVRVCKKDGSFLTTDGITLDMTHFQVNGIDYLAWSYRYGIGTPNDTGSMIYIAATDPEKPWQLTSDPVLLTRPLYGWENTVGTINNEGPYPLITEDKIYLAYSGGSANAYSYVVGYMIADIGADLLDINNWKKTPCPALSSYSVGIDGPGHNSFYISDCGKTMIAYHGQLDIRCSAIHRVHFNAEGFPLLNMSPERDIPEEMRNVFVSFEVE